MTPISVGLTVALGIGIAARIASPHIEIVQAAIGMVFWGATAGFLTRIYQLALQGFRGPFHRR